MTVVYTAGMYREAAWYTPYWEAWEAYIPGGKVVGIPGWIPPSMPQLSANSETGRESSGTPVRAA